MLSPPVLRGRCGRQMTLEHFFNLRLGALVKRGERVDLVAAAQGVLQNQVISR